MNQGREEESGKHNLARARYEEEFPIIRGRGTNQNERNSAYSEAYSSAESDFNRKRDRDNLSTASEEQSPRKQTGVLRSNVRAKIYSYQGVKYHPDHPELSLFVEENGLSKNEIREIRTSRGANRMQQRFQIFKGDDDYIYVLHDIATHHVNESRYHGLTVVAAADPVILHTENEYPEVMYPDPDKIFKTEYYQRLSLKRDRMWGKLKQEYPSNMCKRDCKCQIGRAHV